MPIKPNQTILLLIVYILTLSNAIAGDNYAILINQDSLEERHIKKRMNPQGPWIQASDVASER